MILFKSTRGGGPPLPAHMALRLGAAPDGGLFWPVGPVPAPELDPEASLAETARRLLTPFFAGGPLEHHLGDICRETFNFDAPLIDLPGPDGDVTLLELFHGPTGAFKDFGARFLFRCLDRLVDEGDAITVLAATSGDTGGAVGCAAEGGRARAVILYPKDRVSPFQEHQLTCWDEPVSALRVDGDFDACQRLVKSAFADAGLSRAHGLTSANSINIGRLLPQMAYWAYASLRRPGAGLIIPTGNLGNAVAAITARALGAPIGEIVLATNANRTLADWRRRGEFQARASIATLANAMDVGAPSNFERLALMGDVVANVIAADDSDIRTVIAKTWEQSQYLACPHTATGLQALSELRKSAPSDAGWLIGATAHPFKFAETVKAACGESPAPSPALAAVIDRPTQAVDIQADLRALAAQLEG